MCGAKGYGFLAVLVWNRVSISTIFVWNRLRFSTLGLELGMFLEEATSSSFGDKTISLLVLRQPCTCRNSLSRRAPGLQVWNRVEKITDFVWNRQRVSGNVPHNPTQFFWKYPPGVFVVFYWQMGGHCARRSLRRPWKLRLRIVAWSKPRIFCEESLEKNN